MKTWLLVCLLFGSALTFDQLGESAEREGERVTVRGFLYQRGDGKWILAADPNLRTCCVGSAKKIQQQLVVEGLENPPGTGTAITLEGTFSTAPQYDQNGQLIQLYRLDDAKVRVDRTSAIWPWFIFGSFALAALFVGASRKGRFFPTGKGPHPRKG